MLGLLAGASAARAQATSLEQQIAQRRGAIEEIVVTAQKRSSRLQDIPAAIAVLSGERTERLGIADFEGLIEQIPGVSITADFGGTGSKVISIRGVGGTDDYRPNGSASVALHVDNIFQSSNLFQTMPFFDVERVEVLKGPQGTLYGRNSTAGVVNLITRNPGDAPNGYGYIEYGNYDRFRAEAAAGGPISSVFGVRVAATLDRGGGYMDGKGAGFLAGRVPFPGVPGIPNPGARDGYGDRNLFAARGTLEAKPHESTDIVLKIYGSRDRGENQLGDSVGGVNNGGWIEPDDDPFTFFSNNYPKRNIDFIGGSLNVGQEMSDTVRFDAVLGYQWGERELRGGTGTPRRQFDYIFRDKVQQYTAEARLSSQGDGPLRWVAGGYFQRDRVRFATDLLAAEAIATNLVSNYLQKRRSAAAFAQIDYRFLEQFEFGLGVRYTDDRGTYKGSTIDLNPWGVTRARLSFPAIPVFFDTEAKDDNISGRATLSYQPLEALKIYASFGKGYKASGFDGSTIFNTFEANPIEPEDVLAYEGGFKLSLENGIYFSADAFYYDISDLQAFTVIPLPDGTTSPNLRINVGKSRLYGLDVSGNATLIESGPHLVTAELGFTLLNSKILEFVGTPAQVAANLGNDLPAAPKFSGNASVSYTYSFANGWEASGTLDIRHKGSEFKRLNNATTSATEAFTLLGLRLDVRQSEGGFGVYAFARNLTDETYFLDRNAAGRLVGAPRTFGVGARYSF